MTSPLVDFPAMQESQRFYSTIVAAYHFFHHSTHLFYYLLKNIYTFAIVFCKS